ncbi:DUF3822 family protein [Salegentibacter sediminis]|uniref:DUF3822 family protein n=1 Tax=Salegentibacter sediminis TaxID=1930251 RepID=UPI0009BED8D4|nr:DUF3822 family protein [Salegentibacter sediminis]
MVTNNQTQTKLKLSIQVSLDGLSFCILDTNQEEYIFFKKLSFERQLDPVKILQKIDREYKNEKELQQNIGEISLIFDNSLYTLVPSKLFLEDQASNYLKFNTRILKTDFIAHDEINPAGAVCVYIPYANIINYFFDKYGEFEYKHSISVLLDYLLKKEKSNSPAVYLYNKSGSYDLVVIEDGKLVFCNSFQYETPEDFLYYLLFTAEQLNLDPEKFNLRLFGNISEESDLYQLAYTYIKNISFSEFNTKNTFRKPEEKQRAEGEFVLLNSF